MAGQISEDPVICEPVCDRVREQTERIFNNIRTILEAAVSNLENVLRVDAFHSSMAHKPEFDKFYLKYFPANRLSRNCIAAAGIENILDEEIEIIAGVD